MRVLILSRSWYGTTRALGPNVVAEAIRCVVAQFKGPVAEGELQRAAAFAERFAAAP